MKMINKPGLAGSDGKMIKPPERKPVLEFSTIIKLDPGSDSEPGKMRLKAGAANAYQPLIIALGNGIQFRGAVYVPAKLLNDKAKARARANMDAVEKAKAAAKTDGPAPGKIEEGGIG